MTQSVVINLRLSDRKLLLRGPGRVGLGRGAGTGCEGVCHRECNCPFYIQKVALKHRPFESG